MRLIPARAGNTAGDPFTRRLGAAHPRSRGEHRFTRFSLALACGSSPLARGTPLPRIPRGVVDRLIPARAGNTLRTTDSVRRKPAHPRSRGEHSSAASSGIVLSGSSPLARGTHCTLCCGGGGLRLIPARAGNTFPTASRAKIRAGSSPLARGTRSLFPAPSGAGRLIPARAGNTQNIGYPYIAHGAHPRSRGEH